MLCVTDDRLGRHTSDISALLQRPLPVKARGQSPSCTKAEDDRAMWRVQVALKHLTQGVEETSDSPRRVNQ